MLFSTFKLNHTWIKYKYVISEVDLIERLYMKMCPIEALLLKVTKINLLWLQQYKKSTLHDVQPSKA